MAGQHRKEGSVSGNSAATSSRARAASWVGEPVVVIVVVVVVVNVQRSIL